MPRPIQIKRPDVVDDIRALSDLIGLSITDAVAKAVRTQLEAERASAAAEKAKRLAHADELLRQLHSLPRVGPLLTDKDLYDEDGFPK